MARQLKDWGFFTRMFLSGIPSGLDISRAFECMFAVRGHGGWAEGESIEAELARHLGDVGVYRPLRWDDANLTRDIDKVGSDFATVGRDLHAAMRRYDIEAAAAH